MTALPDPPIPAEVNLEKITWRYIDWTSLLRSDFYAISTGDQFKAAIKLWGNSQHQTPAGSLPTDDRILCFMAGMRKKPWLKAKSLILDGWKLHSDGLLYHPKITEMILATWEETRSKRRLDVTNACWAELRAAVFQRDNYTCVYCGAQGKLACDHVHALSKGGKSVVENLATSCQPCNSSKGAKSLEEWMGA